MTTGQLNANRLPWVLYPILPFSHEELVNTKRDFESELISKAKAKGKTMMVTRPNGGQQVAVNRRERKQRCDVADVPWPTEPPR